MSEPLVINQTSPENNPQNSHSSDPLIAQLVNEIEQTPPEYWPNLLEIIRLFRESVTRERKSSQLLAVTHLPKISQEEQMQRNQAAIALLKKWREDDDEEEQIETAKYLEQTIDEDRLSNRPLFP